MTRVGDRLDGRLVLGVRKCEGQTFALFTFDGDWVELPDAPAPVAEPEPETPTPAPEAPAPDPAPAAPAA